MKKHFYLAKGLHAIFAAAFWLLLIFGLFQTGTEIFTSDGKVWEMTNTHHSSGFYIPVSVQVTVPDSVVTFTGNNTSVSTHYLKGLAVNAVNQQTNDSLANLPHFNKEVINGRFEIIPISTEPDAESPLQANTSRVASDGLLQVKSSAHLLTGLHYLKVYIRLLLLLFAFYLLKSIFHKLSKDLSFSHNLAVKVKWIGLSVIIAELIKVIIHFVYAQYYGVIFAGLTESSAKEVLQVTMNPRLDFNLTLLLVGLSLIVLSSLLKLGNTIEEENQLTV